VSLPFTAEQFFGVFADYNRASTAPSWPSGGERRGWKRCAQAARCESLEVKTVIAIGL
jgi:hypothetical protein